MLLRESRPAYNGCVITHPQAPRSTRAPRPIGGVFLCAFLAILAGAVSCSNVVDNRIPNERPLVRFVRGEVVDRDTVAQQTRLSWIGWDNDGFVSHYQFAFDLEDRTLAEVNDPATTGIAWRDTTVTDALFLFSTPAPETLLGASGQPVITDRYLGRHAFYVRSVDDQGAVSDADVVDFTATNIIPKTRIVSPDFSTLSGFAQVGRRLYVRWSGRDEDKLSPDLRPVAYEYKLIPIPSIFGSIDPQYAVNVSPGPDYPWVRVSGNVTQTYLDLETPKSYWFVVRGIDVAGAVENRYITGQNAFKCSASAANYDRPLLTVTESTFGRHVFPDQGLTADVSVYMDRCLRFNFSANLSAYGGTLQGYNVGVDVPDIDGDEGFQGWSLSPYNIQPICFRTPGLHTVVILCRDTSGQQTVAIYNVRVDPVPPRDRGVLLVDDVNTRSAGNLSDTAMDLKARDLVSAMGFADQDIYTFSTYGEGDLNSSVSLLGREQLGRYKAIVWHVEAGGLSGNGRTGLVSAINCDSRGLLEGHLDTGGALWIIGYRSFGATKRASATGVNCASVVSYDKTNGMNILPTDFLCRIMGICGGDIREVRPTTSKLDGMIRGFPTAEAVADGFPTVEPDSSEYLYQQFGGLPWVDAAFAPIFGGDDLDSLYTMRGVSSNSPFNGKVIAFRHAGSDPASTRGPIAMFGFSFHELKAGSAEERTGYRGMARSMGDWFRRHQAARLSG